MRVLTLLSRNPVDVTSRSARFCAGAARALREAGNEVRVFGTSATEHPDPLPALERLRRAGCVAQVLDARSGGRQRPELHYTAAGIAHRLVDVGRQLADAWAGVHGPAFDAALRDELGMFRPQVVLADPAIPPKRLEKLRAQGICVVQVLPDDRWLEGAAQMGTRADAILCPTEWLAAEYRQRAGAVPVMALPPVVDATEVVAEHAGRECVAVMNPSVDGGLYFLLRLCEEIGLRRPDLPVLVVGTSQGASHTARRMVQAGLAAGFDLRRHENLLFADPAPNPKELWAPVRVMVAPALANPPVDLVLEGLANGVPALISGRGGWPATGAGRVLPLPLDYHRATRQPVAAVDVEPWLDAIEEWDDDHAFAGERQRALVSALAFSPSALAAQYMTFVEGVAQ